MIVALLGVFMIVTLPGLCMTETFPGASTILKRHLSLIVQFLCTTIFPEGDIITLDTTIKSIVEMLAPFVQYTLFIYKSYMDL